MRKLLRTSILPLIVIVFIVLGQMNSGEAIQASQALVERQAEAWRTGNVSLIVSDFAPDAVFIAAGFEFEGLKAIEKAARDYFQQFENTRVTIKRIVLSDLQGAVEWDWSDRNKKTGKISQAEDAIIFELREDGKIIYWREYIEKV